MVQNDDHEDKRIYVVVVNEEEQYSIWLSDSELPNGWRSVGAPAPKSECLARIKELWTDMRPLSLRNWKAQAAG